MGPLVLLVCTANICRSPAMEQLLRARLGGQIAFSSRGIQAVSEAPMCDASAGLALSHGAGSGLSHVARQLVPADIREATIILTASRRHRGAVVAIRPSARVRTFTIGQAARIMGWRGSQGARPPAADLPDRLLWLGEELDTYRAAAPQPELAEEDDLPDPHVRARHSDVFPRLVEAVDAICSVLLRPV